VDRQELISLTKSPLAPQVPLSVYDALDLVTAFETSEYLSLVSPNEFIRTASD